jgi:hypothetical protein
MNCFLQNLNYHCCVPGCLLKNPNYDLMMNCSWPYRSLLSCVKKSFVRNLSQLSYAGNCFLNTLGC